MKKKPLAWDEWNRKHIKKHNVIVQEVEEAYRSKTKEQGSYKERKIILGKTNKGRLLTIVLSFESKPGPYVVSARDMSSKERRIYHEEQKKDNKQT